MYLGIDLGTSEVKVLLLASDGRVIGTAGSPFTVSRPHQRWAEQNPEDWWAGTRAALAALRAKHPDEFAQIRGIGLSGQMHGPSCSMRKIAYCGPRSCGTTCAATRNAPS